MEMHLLHASNLKLQKIIFHEQFQSCSPNGLNFILQEKQNLQAFHYVPLQFTLQDQLHLQIGRARYILEEGSIGIVILVNFLDFQGVPTEKVSSLEDYVNNFLYFHSRGFSLKQSELKILIPQEGRKSSQNSAFAFFPNIYKQLKSSDKLVRTDTTSSKLNIQSVLQSVDQTSKEFYLTLHKCDVNLLMLFLFHQFGSFEQMIQTLGKGRFLVSLLTHICYCRAAQFIFIFQDQQLELLRQSSKGLVQLKLFYELASLNLKQIKIEATHPDNQLETTSKDVNEFIRRIPRNKHQLMYGLQINRSAFMMPPSHHPATLEMSALLFNTHDRAVFQTKLLKLFIHQRYQEAKPYFLLTAVLLLTQLGLLFVHSAFVRDGFVASTLLLILVIIQVWMLIVEIIEIAHRRLSYFKEFWNWFDLCRIFLTFLYFGLINQDALSETSQSNMLTLLNLFQSLRTFSVFSVFKGTRVLLRGVIQIIRDMTAFFIFVTFTSLLHALFFTSGTPQNRLVSLTYTRRLFIIFLLDFGYFDVGSYSPIQEFLFVIAVITVRLIMLNMLISIMGDTYARVKEGQARRDLQELVGLVQQYQVLAKVLCKCKEKQPWKYIYYSREKLSVLMKTQSQWEGRVDSIKEKLNKFQKKRQNWQQAVNQKFRERDDWQRANQEWQRKLDRSQRKLEVQRESIGLKLRSILKRFTKTKRKLIGKTPLKLKKKASDQ